MSATSNLSDEAQSLARIPLFQRLEPHELEHLAEDVEQVDYKAGEIIFHEYDTGDRDGQIDEVMRRLQSSAERSS